MATIKRSINGVCGHLTPKDFGKLVTGSTTLKKRSYGFVGFNRKSHGTKPKSRKRK